MSGLYASDSSLWLMTVESGASYAVLQVDIASFVVVHSTPMPSQSQLYGVDSKGQSLLIGLASYQYVWLVSADDGQQRLQYDGGLTKLEVLAAAYLPGSGDVLLADLTSASLLHLRPNNSVASSLPLPLSRQTLAVTICADEARSSLFVFYWSLVDDAYVLLQYNLSSHALLGRFQVNDSWPLSFRYGFQGIAVAAEPGQLYFADPNTASVELRDIASGKVTTLQLYGNPPWMRWPTDVAALDGRVYVATNAAISGSYTPWQGIAAMDVDGRPVAAEAEWSVDRFRSSYNQQLAAGKDADGRTVIVAPLSNGTVAVYNAQLEQTAVVRFPQGNARPFSVALSLGAESLFVIDAGQPDVLAEYNMQGKQLRTLQASHAAGAFSDVAVSPADGSIWATDGLNGTLYHWAANGTQLSSRAFGYLHELWSVAVDAAHHQLLLSENVWSDDGQHGRYQLLFADVLWLDLDTGATLASFTYPNGDQATGVAVSEDGSRVYTPAFGLNALFVFEQQRGAAAASSSSSSALSSASHPLQMSSSSLSFSSSSSSSSVSASQRTLTSSLTTAGTAGLLVTSQAASTGGNSTGSSATTVSTSVLIAALVLAALLAVVVIAWAVHRNCRRKAAREMRVSGGQASNAPLLFHPVE